MLVDKFELMIKHIQKQADKGKKFVMGETPTDEHTDYQMFYNEVVLCDNSILVSIESEKMLFLTHNTLNYLFINNKEYCELTYKWMKNLQKRSTVISAVSEKLRNQFFALVDKKIQQTREKLG